MATIKSFTDIPQSKKLAEFLPIESADMWYSYYGNSKYNPTIAYEGQQWFLCQIRNGLHDIPCWSLAVLLDVLPNYQIQTQDDGIGILCSCNGKFNIITVDNPVDACYEMIIKLHEQKLL